VAAFVTDHLAEYRLVGDDPLTTHFVDGGLLDNSPFDHTITAIAAKSAQGPVDRRIVHIDPDPGDWPAVAGDPAAAQQPPTWAAGVKTALAVQRSQSLVRDLDDLQQLNQTISSVGAITSDLQQRVDVELRSITGPSGTTHPSREDIQAWSSAVHARVPAVAGTVNIATYQRLKVAAVADMLGIDLAGALGYPPGSQPADFIRSVFTVWFSRPDSLPIHTAGELAELLGDVDLPYRERRLRFLISGVNRLFSQPQAGVSATSLRDLKGRAWAVLNALLDFRAAAARSLNGDPTAFLTSSALVELSPAAFVDAHVDDLSDLSDRLPAQTPRLPPRRLRQPTLDNLHRAHVEHGRQHTTGTARPLPRVSPVGRPHLPRHRAVQTAATHPDHAATHQHPRGGATPSRRWPRNTETARHRP